MPNSRAAYMRDYRAAHKKVAEAIAQPCTHDYRIAELEEEVRHLKEELAKREPVGVERMELLGRGAIVTDGGFNTRPFTPVPKKGHG